MVTPIFVEINQDKELVDLVVMCKCCGELNEVQLSTDEYRNYFTDDMKIQDAMPNQTLDVRELCVSGTCAQCWDEMFAEEE